MPLPLLQRLALVTLVAAALGVHAAPAEIANTPLANETATAVKANLMFVLDDSGSMAEEHIPDEVGINETKRCYGYSGYNKIFFNPTLLYPAPMSSQGLPMADSNFNAAPVDGFNGGGARNLADPANLSTPITWVLGNPGAPTVVTGVPVVCGDAGSLACSVVPQNTTTRDGNTVVTVDKAFVRGDAPGLTCGPDANSCTLTTTTTTTTTQIVSESKFYWATLKPGAANDCNDLNYDVVTNPADLTAEQRANYANWFTYYRTRMLMMRSATGRAFNNIDGTRFRIGFSTISDNGGADGAKFLNVADFEQPQKDAFYGRLYGTQPAGSTPLRSALSKAGKYFANKVPGQTDPMQYSCQRNFTILSTDGYWNTAAEPNRGNFVPTRLDGTTAIGNTDAGDTPRPMLDDGRTQNDNWVTGGGGVSNSLADIAKYYYDTDLRTGNLGNCQGSVAGQDVCENDVGISAKDIARHQHMTTFTLGLGVSGVLQYQPDYETATAGDFFAIRNGTRPWPNPESDTRGGLASNNNTVTARIDDLWHAAVNGSGTYFSAGNPVDLATSLTNALQTIQTATGTGAAAATSTLKPVPGDNFVFLGQYTSPEWSGNIKAMSIDLASGNLLENGGWEASKTLATQVQPAADTRRILFFSAAAPTKLLPFTFANLDAARLGDHFRNLCQGAEPRLTQCPNLAALGGEAVAAANNGANVVDFLRGQTQFEQRIANPPEQRLFRERPNTPLGDIINASPLYLKKSPFKYTDAGYAGFSAATTARQGVVYVAANDGMLHAFNADNGTELWAYVPTMVMENLHALADAQYGANHRFFVDSTPTIGDVFAGGRWRTVLVGGLGAGGRGYYALDITDPAAPQALWEISAGVGFDPTVAVPTTFVDEDLGLTYGNPVITKKWDPLESTCRHASLSIL